MLSHSRVPCAVPHLSPPLRRCPFSSSSVSLGWHTYVVANIVVHLRAPSTYTYANERERLEMPSTVRNCHWTKCFCGWFWLNEYTTSKAYELQWSTMPSAASMDIPTLSVSVCARAVSRRSHGITFVFGGMCTAYVCVRLRMFTSKFCCIHLCVRRRRRNEWHNVNYTMFGRTGITTQTPCLTQQCATFGRTGAHQISANGDIHFQSYIYIDIS